MNLSELWFHQEGRYVTLAEKIVGGWPPDLAIYPPVTFLSEDILN